MKIAIGTQIYLPYTQSWIYRQMKGTQEGIALVICNKLENLDEYPFSPIHVVPDRSLWMRKVIYKLDFLTKYFSFHISRKKQKGYSKALISHQIDMVHVHFGIMAVEFMAVCQKMKLPLLVTFHGFDITAAVHRNPAYQKNLLQLFKKMNTGIAISNEMKGRLIEMGCSPDKIKVSYLGIPLNEFLVIDRSEHRETVKFLHAGRLSATKGVPDLVDAFSMAFNLYDEVELFIVGDGEEADLVRQAITRSPIKDKIKFLGKVSHEDLRKWRADCDVFILNCRTPASGDKEGLPIALLEASATALPIISTKHSGIDEGVLHEQTGLLVEEYNQIALSEAMRKMMDKEIRLLYGTQGRRWMEEQFDLVKCNKVLDEIYNQAIFNQ